VEAEVNIGTEVFLFVFVAWGFGVFVAGGGLVLVAEFGFGVLVIEGVTPGANVFVGVVGSDGAGVEEALFKSLSALEPATSV
jgi:hypothetical protein